MKKASKLLSVLLVLALVLTACGTQSGTSTEESVSEASVSESTESSVETSTEASSVATSEESSTATDDALAKSFDVVVVGAGGAGLTAAIAADEAGAEVLLLEKMPVAGGNTSLATAGMNAAGTEFQKEQGIEDSVDTFIQDTMTGGKDLNDPALVRYLAENSAAAITWLDGIGIRLDNLTATGGTTPGILRTHRPSDGSAVGGYLVAGLLKEAEKRQIEIRYDSPVTELVKGDKGVTGVVVTPKEGKPYEVSAISVILTTGGFGGNLDMVVENNPALKGFVTTNAAGVTGDGIKMAEAIGAAVRDMDQIQIHPTVDPTSGGLLTEALRGDGGILINKEGKRFIDEMQTRDVVSAEELKQTDGQAYLILDGKVAEKNTKNIAKYDAQGYTTKAETIADLAKAIGVDPVTFQETIDTYNAGAANGTDTAFGREQSVIAVDTAPYIAIKVAPGIHHTMGGIVIDTDTHVIDTEGNPIPGLYAAGEVTGGVHGGNRLGGNAVADIEVFGSQAGRISGKYALDNGGVGDVDDASAAVEENVVPNEGVAAQFKDGTYETTVTGHNGDLKVEITVEGGYITKVAFPENAETPPLFDAASSSIVPQIIKTQTTEGIDTVSTATVSSQAILDAVTELMNANRK